MEFTNDATLITRVWASFPLDAVFPENDQSFDDNETEFEPRLSVAYDKMEAAIRAEFPNVTNIWVENTGWEGNWAQFTPRADNPDYRGENVVANGYGLVYEPFFDWLTEVQDSLA